MGRVYSAAFSAVTMAATTDIDVFEIAAPATSMLRILSCTYGQSSDFGDSEAELLPWTIERATASGSGGSTVTPTPLNVGHAASGVTSVEFNNSTIATTRTLMQAGTWNIQAGYFYNPIPEEMIWVPPSGILVFGMNDTAKPATAYTTSFYGTLIYEEFD